MHRLGPLARPVAAALVATDDLGREQAGQAHTNVVFADAKQSTRGDERTGGHGGATKGRQQVEDQALAVGLMRRILLS